MGFSSVGQALCFRSDQTETRHLYWIAVGRSSIFISFIFLSVGVLQLAIRESERGRDACRESTDDDEGCGGRVYGMRPTSLLSNMATIGGLATVIFMPYAGAVVEFSPKRREFMIWIVVVLVVVNALQAFLFYWSWFPLFLLQAVVATAGVYALSMCYWAYITEQVVLNDEDGLHNLYGVVAAARFWDTFGMLSFMIVVVIIQIAIGLGGVDAARVSQVLCAICGGVGCGHAIYLSPRAAVHTKEDGVSLWVAGFKKLVGTLRDIRQKYPELFKFIVMEAFTGSATSSFATLAVTYLSFELEMSAVAVSGFILVLLLFMVPAVFIQQAVTRMVGLRVSLLIALGMTVFTTVLFVGILAGPQHKQLAWIFTVPFGIFVGWIYPAESALFTALIPGGEELQFWGINLFASAILTWFPPLVFTILDEVTGSLRVAMSAIILVTAIGFSCLLAIDVDKGRDDVCGTLGARQCKIKPPPGAGLLARGPRIEDNITNGKL